MSDITDQEIKDLYAIFQSVEARRLFEDYQRKREGCPPIQRFQDAARNGWTDDYLDHVARRCEICLKQTAMQWNIESPRLASLLRHLLDGTCPDEETIQRYVDNQADARRIAGIRRMFGSVIRAERAVPVFLSSLRPMEMLTPGLSFAPAGAETTRDTGERDITDTLRWSAPVESADQYVYVAATAGASVLVVVSSAPDHENPSDPLSIRLELSRLALRGTPFVWRLAHKLGPASELIERFGRDYEVAVVVSP